MGTRIFLYMALSLSLPGFASYCHAGSEKAKAMLTAPMAPRLPLARRPGISAHRRTAASIRSHAIGGGERAGADETFEPASAGVHLAPVRSGEVDDGQAGCRQSLVEALAGLDIARGDQQAGEVMQSGIVSD